MFVIFIPLCKSRLLRLLHCISLKWCCTHQLYQELQCLWYCILLESCCRQQLYQELKKSCLMFMNYQRRQELKCSFVMKMN